MMGASPAPERRKGPLGQRQVRIGHEWLDEDAPGTMAAWARAQAEERAIARVAIKEPTARQQEAWDAVREHGTQVAAAKALGVSQGGLQGRLQGYMKAKGIEGDLPGRQGKRQAEREVTRSALASDSVSPGPVADAAHIVSTERHDRGDCICPNDADRAMGCPAHASGRFPALADAGADHASDMHPAVSSAELELVDEGDIIDAQRTGYAIGYAVATLRAIAALADLPKVLGDMASESADGLSA